MKHSRFVKCSLLFVCSLLLNILSCSGGGSGGSGNNETSSSPEDVRMELDFARVKTGVLNPFRVTVTVTRNSTPMTGIASDISINTSRGVVGLISEVADGIYEFTVTPSQTGEHEVTVEYGAEELSITRTALVLDHVHDDWGQAMAVGGLVNTEGYEDGVTITPDGEYLFVQYGPLYFSALILFNFDRADGGCGGDRLNPTRCTHPWFDETIGPTTAPERPGFFDSRFANGRWLHNAVSWGLLEEQSPIFAPATMFYGFRHQGDGVFAEPFYLAFDDEGDAIINPYGLSFSLNGDGTAQVSYSVNDPADEASVDLDNDGLNDVESFIDVYTTVVTLGENTSLGGYVPSGVAGTPPIRASFFPSTLVDFGRTGTEGIAGTQGNSHLYTIDSSVASVWTDDEYDTGGDVDDISVYMLDSGTLTNGNWSKLVLPSAINQPEPSREFQPFFTGNELFFTHASTTKNPEVFRASYSGEHSLAGFNDNNNWGSTEVVLGVGSQTELGNIVAIGEPTIANTVDGTYLYFVYGYIRGYDTSSNLADINMQAGYIRLDE